MDTYLSCWMIKVMIKVWRSGLPDGMSLLYMWYYIQEPVRSPGQQIPHKTPAVHLRFCIQDLESANPAEKPPDVPEGNP